MKIDSREFCRKLILKNVSNKKVDGQLNWDAWNLIGRSIALEYAI